MATLPNLLFSTLLANNIMLKYMDSEAKTMIDNKKNRYPYCLVWTPLPLITAVLPFIGHTGICTSEGIIHDFAGPYTVSVDDMAFGKPTKYVKLKLTPEEKQRWNLAVTEGDRKYGQEMHNLFCNNCHSHVAYVMNQVGYKHSNWNMVKVWWLFVAKGKYLGFSGFMKSYLGFFILLSIVLLLSFII